MADRPKAKSMAEMAAEAQGGLQCPNCGCKHFNVLSTYPSKSDSVIRRRRSCRHCGYRISTAEKRVPDASHTTA